VAWWDMIAVLSWYGSMVVWWYDRLQYCDGLVGGVCVR
jgi:hypothetical protein